MSQSQRRCRVASLAAVCACSSFLAIGAPPAAAETGQICDGQWHIQASPSVSGASSVLASVWAFSTADAWAVGHETTQNLIGGTTDDTLLEHWDGRAWSIVPGAATGTSSPLPGAQPTYEGDLYGVYGSGGADVWAVGSSGGKTLIEHWNGSAWTIAASPSITGTLNAVWTDSAADAWSVGAQSSGSSTSGVTERWNGTAWTAIAGADSTTLHGWAAVSGSGPADVWTVATSNAGRGTLVTTEHWNGASWTQHPGASNGPSNTGNTVTGAADISPADVWLTGTWQDGVPPFSYPNAETWDSRQWNEHAPTYSTGSRSDRSEAFLAMSAASAGDIWFVGHGRAHVMGDPYKEQPPQTLAVHYDGTTFSYVASEDASGNDELTAVSALRDRAWAVGFSTSPTSGRDSTLIETECAAPIAAIPESPWLPGLPALGLALALGLTLLSTRAARKQSSVSPVA